MTDHRKVKATRKSTGAYRLRERRITVLLVDIRAWTREAVGRALEKASRGIRVLRFGDVSDIQQTDLDSGSKVVLINVTGTKLADSGVTTAFSALSSSLPGVPVVALSDSNDPEEILNAIERGLNGYIPMSLELRSVVEALRFVAAGGTFVPAEPLLACLDAATPANVPPQPAKDTTTVGLELASLTPRELAVLNLLRQAKSNKRIARELDLSEATVKVHVRHIMRKLGAVNRTQVALLADGLLG